MEQSDKLLTRLIKRVNDSGTFLPLTLVVNGAMITGRVAPRTSWLNHNERELKASSIAEFGLDFVAEMEDDDGGTDYLHLSGAKVIFGNAILPHSGGAFRVPLSAISAWTIGEVKASN
ncbi:hypothetical protein [Streptomyces sp. NPDC056056]|uniref:hypothetical protein n=1 Tax=Streptomyces sp. NPDC056056 TaxID=3345698 RepID=UPI0035D59842